MNIEVLRPGAQTTVQDRGRTGLRHLGIGVAGALDAYSAAVANLLVGNDESSAVLEIALSGPTLHFACAARIALAGADIDAHCGDAALPGWRPITLPAGSELRLGACRRGARAYLAVAGGIGIAPVLGSRSTDLRAGFGGVAGRALRRADTLPIAADPSAACELRVATWWIDPKPDLDLAPGARVHLLPGRDATAPAESITHQAWRVSEASNRQGLRLQGEALALSDPGERLSTPTVPGTVQLPPDGHPIVLLADAQTIGGYPCIGQVCLADLPRLAQCRPGDSVHFQPIDRAAALARHRARQQRLARIELAIAQRERNTRRG